jgi:hypothetical protein
MAREVHGVEFSVSAISYQRVIIMTDRDGLSALSGPSLLKGGPAPSGAQESGYNGNADGAFHYGWVLLSDALLPALGGFGSCRRATAGRLEWQTSRVCCREHRPRLPLSSPGRNGAAGSWASLRRRAAGRERRRSFRWRLSGAPLLRQRGFLLLDGDGRLILSAAFADGHGILGRACGENE